MDTRKDKPLHVRLAPEGWMKEHQQVSEPVQSYNELATYLFPAQRVAPAWEIVAFNNIKIERSRCQWFESIPANWTVQKLKYISFTQFSNVDKKSAEGEEPVRLCNYVDVYYKDFITADLELMEATATSAEIRKFELRDGDVLITKDSESWDDIAIPACVVGNHKGVLCGYHLAQVRVNQSQTDGKYLFRSFCARGINDQLRVAATGITRYGLGKHWIDNGLFPVPPIDEQRAIAAFLDRETARIDALIEKKKRQIELLGYNRILWMKIKKERILRWKKKLTTNIEGSTL